MLLLMEMGLGGGGGDGGGGATLAVMCSDSYNFHRLSKYKQTKQILPIECSFVLYSSLLLLLMMTSEMQTHRLEALKSVVFVFMGICAS